MSELAGKVAIVTGASRRRGLGRALALSLARAGANILVCAAPNGEKRLAKDEVETGWRGLSSVVEEVQALGVEGVGCAVDLRDPKDVRAMVAKAVSSFGRVDILVNNAAFPRANDRVPLVELADETWKAVIDVNLTGTMLCCKYVAKQLIQQGNGGTIISISSIAAMTAQETFSAYSASKAAIHALNGSLAAELGPHGITCNVVAPGFLDTARTDVLRSGGRWEERLRTIPLRRPGQAGEIAEIVRFLCGPHARFMTGEVVVVDGGEVRRASR